MRRLSFLLLLTFAVLLAPARLVAQGDGSPVKTENTKAVEAEAAFIERMVEEAGKGGGQGDGKGGTPEPKGGTPKAEGAAKKEGEAGAEEDAGEGKAEEGDGTESGGDGEGAAEEEAGEEEEGESAEGSGDTSEDGLEDGDDGEADAEADTELEAEEGDELPASDELADLDPEDEAPVKLEAALRKHGAKAIIDKLPKALRPIVRKRLAEMEAPFTRAMKEATGFRAERAELLADKKFRQDNPVDFVLDMLLADPSLGEKVNARLDEIADSPTAREAHTVVAKDKRKQALEAVTEESTKTEQRLERAAAVERYVEREMARLGIPAELGVEEAVALKITERGDITRTEIDAILKAKQRQAETLLRGKKRGDRRQYIDSKLKDRKTAGLKAPPGKGSSTAPGKAKAIKSEAEFLEHMETELAARGY